MEKTLFTLCFLTLSATLIATTAVQAQFYGDSPPAAENVLIILDASDSMNEKIGRQTKMEAAKEVVLNTIRSFPPNVNVGLRVYGHRFGSGQSSFRSFMTGGEICRQTQLLVPLRTNNRATLATQLMDIQAVGKTLITYALKQAVMNDFVGLPGKKTIILVTDGRETCSYNPCDLALDMVRTGIDVKINTIGFATHDRVADDQLKCIALSTKGKFYSADTATELAKGLQDSSQIQTSVQAKIYAGQ